MEERVLEVMPTRLSDAGLLRAGGRQRTDSPHVLAAVRTLNRMEFVGETPRAALEALAAAAPGWLTGLTDSSWAERYGVRNEGTISQAVRRTRLRRTPYQGQAKTHLANVLSATAINLVRVDAWLNNTPLGTRLFHLARLDLAA